MRLLAVFLTLVFAVAELAPAALALPGRPSAPAGAEAGQPVILAATKSQRAAARAACRRQYGSRLTDVVVTKRGAYRCYYRPSTKTLTKRAATACGKQGRRLVKIVSIKSGKRVTTTRYRCGPRRR